MSKQLHDSASETEARAPRPGLPARGTRTGRPLLVAFDLLGRRWALRVLWELRDGDSLTFRELQARCGQISSSVLNDRLRELRNARIVEAGRGGGYLLTTDGQDLLGALAPLNAWSQRWAKRSSTPAKPR